MFYGTYIGMSQLSLKEMLIKHEINTCIYHFSTHLSEEVSHWCIIYCIVVIAAPDRIKMILSWSMDYVTYVAIIIIIIFSEDA